MATYIVTCTVCNTANRVSATNEGKVGRCGSCKATLPVLYRQPQQLTDRTFDSFREAFSGPILAEFWAPW